MSKLIRIQGDEQQIQTHKKLGNTRKNGQRRTAKQTQQHHHSAHYNMTGESENLQRIFNKHNVPIYFKPFSTLELLHPKDLTPKHKAILYIQFSAVKNALTCTSRKQSNCCISALKGKPLRADYRWFKWAVKEESQSIHPCKAFSQFVCYSNIFTSAV